MNEQALKHKLATIARERNMRVNSCWKILLLERFLARLASSSHSHKFIFKGGFLLSYLMKIGRETTDIDFLLTRINAEAKEIRKAFEEIVSVYSEDGFHFSFRSIELLSQPHMEYPGYRVILNGTFAKRKDIVQIDIGVGDLVEPTTRELLLVQSQGKPVFESVISLLVYPVETIFSEKLETIISKGINNSRMKDYHDLLLILRNGEMLNSSKLNNTIKNTFSHRGTLFRPIEFDKNGLTILQQLWTAHLNGLGDVVKDLNLPKDISTAIEEINNYVAGELIG